MERLKVGGGEWAAESGPWRVARGEWAAESAAKGESGCTRPLADERAASSDCASRLERASAVASVEEATQMPASAREPAHGRPRCAWRGSGTKRITMIPPTVRNTTEAVNTDS